MTIKKWTYNHVNKTGILKSGGSVHTKKGVYSSELHGCSTGLCKCTKEDWVSINLGYNAKEKTVSGITFYFNNPIEFNKFLEKLEPVS